MRLPMMANEIEVVMSFKDMRSFQSFALVIASFLRNKCKHKHMLNIRILRFKSKSPIVFDFGLYLPTCAEYREQRATTERECMIS